MDQPKRGLANTFLESGPNLSDIQDLTFYSPPSEANERDGTKVGDARFLILKNMADQEQVARIHYCIFFNFI